MKILTLLPFLCSREKFEPARSPERTEDKASRDSDLRKDKMDEASDHRKEIISKKNNPVILL